MKFIPFLYAAAIAAQEPAPAAASPNLEFAVYMLVASPDAAKNEPVPETLDSVVKQMRAVFTYKGFRVAETLLLRSRSGKGAEASSFSPLPGVDGVKTYYQFRFGLAQVVDKPGGRIIKIDALRAGVRVPYKTSANGGAYQFADIGFNTDIDVKEGQKAVVGKGSMEGNEALIVVVIPKVVD
ncbi:MAG: hypothetical protein SFV18_05055 [Bryobacteraceae bacterium]|nr:hypothetical protein [Bryobacteraceae bacterium]